MRLSPAWLFTYEEARARLLLIAVGAAPTAIKSNLARASTYVKSQAGLNLTAIRGRRR